jgi:DNA mismatch endonuclease, patch repair protein
MTDVYDAAKRSAVMRRVKGSGTTPERTLRRLLTRLGARYRLNRKDLAGTPDLVLPGRRLAIFAHGCFWHGHDCPRGARVPKTNRDYWLGKVARNRARDAAVDAALVEAGWGVEVVWECEMKDEAALTGRLAALLDTSPLASTRRHGRA